MHIGEHSDMGRIHCDRCGEQHGGRYNCQADEGFNKVPNSSFFDEHRSRNLLEPFDLIKQKA